MNQKSREKSLGIFMRSLPVKLASRMPVRKTKQARLERFGAENMRLIDEAAAKLVLERLRKDRPAPEKRVVLSSVLGKRKSEQEYRDYWREAREPNNESRKADKEERANKARLKETAKQEAKRIFSAKPIQYKERSEVTYIKNTKKSYRKLK